MALPSLHRLKSRQDFQAVFRKGIRRRGSYMTLRALRSKPLVPNNRENLPPSPTIENSGEMSSCHPTRIGISVSTKVSKRAVVRNRIKRQIAAALYKLLPRLLPGWRLVIAIEPAAAQQECGSQQFLQELEQLLAQAEVFNGHS